MLKNRPETKNSRDLKLLENQYRRMVKTNPASFNETREHMKAIQKLVQDMRRVRSRMGRVTPESLSWLQEILDRPAV